MATFTEFATNNLYTWIFLILATSIVEYAGYPKKWDRKLAIGFYAFAGANVVALLTAITFAAIIAASGELGNIVIALFVQMN